MRISGNYFERLLVVILPFTAIAPVILYLVDNSRKEFLPIGALFTGLLWSIDILIIHFRFKPKTLHAGNTLRCGRKRFTADEIHHMTPVSTRSRRWRFDFVELHLRNGTILTIIDKPQFFFAQLWEKPSGTIKRLIKRYPELEGRDHSRRWV